MCMCLVCVCVCVLCVCGCVWGVCVCVCVLAVCVCVCVFGLCVCLPYAVRKCGGTPKEVPSSLPLTGAFQKVSEGQGLRNWPFTLRSGDCVLAELAAGGRVTLRKPSEHVSVRLTHTTWVHMIHPPGAVPRAASSGCDQDMSLRLEQTARRLWTVEVCRPTMLAGTTTGMSASGPPTPPMAPAAYPPQTVPLL